MHSNILRAGLLVISVSIISGCVPTLIGAVAYNTKHKRKRCVEFLQDPDFKDKINIPEYKAAFETICGDSASEKARELREAKKGE